MSAILLALAAVLALPVGVLAAKSVRVVNTVTAAEAEAAATEKAAAVPRRDTQTP